ncbi:MAG TPA: 50S ribosomal protein L18 [Candidatus Hydrogenedentes bacterium]|nr:50S ribosomal protein L18 [Candidatus Hydrogenedentota bacterium]HIJ73789.1 50S ribosomal protein L18 [Candidatus Hydrogenedentota bacterium]
MANKNRRVELLARRRRRVRKKVAGVSSRPRLSVYRSLRHIYAQIIDDSSGKTIVAASSVALKAPGGNIEGATAVGKALAERAKAASIDRVSFDRGGRLFHGRVKALADAARKGGLQF